MFKWRKPKLVATRERKTKQKVDKNKFSGKNKLRLLFVWRTVIECYCFLILFFSFLYYFFHNAKNQFNVWWGFLFSHWHKVSIRFDRYISLIKPFQIQSIYFSFSTSGILPLQQFVISGFLCRHRVH